MLFVSSPMMPRVAGVFFLPRKRAVGWHDMSPNRAESLSGRGGSLAPRAVCSRRRWVSPLDADEVGGGYRTSSTPPGPHRGRLTGAPGRGSRLAREVSRCSDPEGSKMLEIPHVRYYAGGFSPASATSGPVMAYSSSQASGKRYRASSDLEARSSVTDGAISSSRRRLRESWSPSSHTFSGTRGMMLYGGCTAMRRKGRLERDGLKLQGDSRSEVSACPAPYDRRPWPFLSSWKRKGCGSGRMGVPGCNRRSDGVVTDVMLAGGVWERILSPRRRFAKAQAGRKASRWIGDQTRGSDKMEDDGEGACRGLPSLRGGTLVLRAEPRRPCRVVRSRRAPYGFLVGMAAFLLMVTGVGAVSVPGLYSDGQEDGLRPAATDSGNRFGVGLDGSDASSGADVRGEMHRLLKRKSDKGSKGAGDGAGKTSSEDPRSVSALVVGGNFTLNGQSTNVAQYDPVR